MICWGILVFLFTSGVMVLTLNSVVELIAFFYWALNEKSPMK